MTIIIIKKHFALINTKRLSIAISKTLSSLKLLLSRWRKLIDNDYLLFDTNNNPLTPVKLNQRLNKIFDGKIMHLFFFLINDCAILPYKIAIIFVINFMDIGENSAFFPGV